MAGPRIHVSSDRGAAAVAALLAQVPAPLRWGLLPAERPSEADQAANVCLLWEATSAPWPGVPVLRVASCADRDPLTLVLGLRELAAEVRGRDVARTTIRQLGEFFDLYRSLSEAAHDVIFVVDASGQVAYVNRSGAHLLGMHPDDIRGRNLADLFPAETAQRMVGNIRRVLEAGAPDSFETSFAFGGRQVWLETRLVPLPPDGEGRRRLVGYARDWTAIRQWRQLVQAMVEPMGDRSPAAQLTHLVQLVTRAGRVESALILGRSLEDDSEDSFLLLATAGEEGAWVRAAWPRLIGHLERLGPGVHLVAPSLFGSGGEAMGAAGVADEGRLFAVELGEVEGVAAGWLLVVWRGGLDPAERRWMEDVLSLVAARATAELEARAAAHQMQQALAERDGAVRMKSEFLSMVSHDLRSPLASVIGGLENALGGIGGPLTDVQRQLLEVAFRNARRLEGLINDLLDVNRLEAKGLPLQRELIDLGSLAARAVEDFRPRLGSKKVELALFPSPCRLACRVECDRHRLLQVLTNLLDNASTYAASKIGVILDCRDGRPRLIVADDGPGIAPTDRERVFERFWRGARAPRGAGAGLGLAIARSLVAAQGGELVVAPTLESALGESRCDVEAFGRLDGAVMSLSMACHTCAHRAATPGLGSRAAAILHVAPDSDARTRLREALKRQGVSCRSLGDRRAAQLSLADEVWSLVVLGPPLPEDAGWCRELLAHADRPPPLALWAGEDEAIEHLGTLPILGCARSLEDLMRIIQQQGGPGNSAGAAD